jgi:hypothetical protein
MIALLADPLLRLWVGRRLEDPEASIPAAMLMIQILMIGIAVRSVSDGWMRILYGVGMVRAYAPLVLLGGVVNPLLALGLVWLLPEGSMVQMLGPSIATSGVLLIVHGLILPAITARCAGMSYGDVLLPLLRPALATLAGAIVLVVAAVLIETWTVPWLLAICAGFGAAYTVAVLAFVATPQDRQIAGRILTRLRGRLTGLRPPVDGSTGSR